MTNINVNEILNNYTEEEQKYLYDIMCFLAYINANNAPKNDKEFKAWCEKALEDKREEEAKEEAKKAKKLANEMKKANEMGLTLDEYKEYKKIRAKFVKHNNKAKDLEEWLAEEKSKAEYFAKKLEKYENKG
jgi:hypothetical protein